MVNRELTIDAKRVRVSRDVELKNVESPIKIKEVLALSIVR